MADWEKEELQNLHQEYEWVLHEEVHSVFEHLRHVLTHCAQQFPIPVGKNEAPFRQDKFVMGTPAQTSLDQIKGIVTITGDTVSHADVSVKLSKHNAFHHTVIHESNPWKLQQVQDTANHLQLAMQELSIYDKEYAFKSAEEVLNIVGCILGYLKHSRDSLLIPRKRTVDELMNSHNMKNLSPALPADMALSFYIQSQKLILAIYHLTTSHGNVRYDTMQAEHPVAWLNDILVSLTVALQLCSQLKEKLTLFTQYKEANMGSRSTSANSW